MKDLVIHWAERGIKYLKQYNKRDISGIALHG